MLHSPHPNTQAWLQCVHYQPKRKRREQPDLSCFQGLGPGEYPLRDGGLHRDAAVFVFSALLPTTLFILSYVAPPPPHPSLTLAHVLQALDAWEWAALQTIGSEGCLPSLPVVNARVTPSAALISTTALLLMEGCLHLFFVDLVMFISLDRRSCFFLLRANIFIEDGRAHDYTAHYQALV